MTIATYADLKAAVASWSSRTDQTTNIPDFIAFAHQEIGRRLRASVNTERADALAITGEYIAQPTRFRAIRRLYFDTTPRRIVRMATPEQRIDAIAAAGSTVTYPTLCSVEGDELAFGPVPGGSVTAKALYYAEPTALSADGDTNAVLTKYPFLYLFGALAALYTFLEEDDDAARYQASFAGLILDINNAEAADAMRGPLTAGRSTLGAP